MTLVSKAANAEELRKVTVGLAELGDSQQKSKPFRTLAEALAGALADTGAFGAVVERSQMQKILGEQGKSLSATYDESSAPELGKLLGAQLMVLGTYTLPPDAKTVRVNARLVRVEKGSLVSSASVEILCTPAIEQELKPEPPKPPEPKPAGKATTTSPTVVVPPRPPQEPKPEPMVTHQSLVDRIRENPVPVSVAGGLMVLVVIALALRPKRCPNPGCGAKIIKGAEHCDQCGAKLT